MICAVQYNGQRWFLDANEKYKQPGIYAERIAGRQVMIENGNEYLLEKPGGEQRDVDMYESVSVQDDRDNKKQKIAIADLQVGDIIDYYVGINKDAAKWFTNPDPLDYSIGEKYPFLDFSLDVRAFKKMGVFMEIISMMLKRI